MEASPRDKGIELVKRASEEDAKKNYKEALSLYRLGIEYLILAAKHEKHPAVKNTLNQKIEEYLERAEDIKQYLQQHAEAEQHSQSTDGSEKAAKKRKEHSGSNPLDEHLRTALETTILKEKPNVKWSEIAGLESAKEALKEAVILPLKAPQLFESRLEPWRGILLYGPPGTGKTQLAKAVATECNSTFFSVSSADLVSKYVGESERLIKQLFQMARESKPAVIFLDEIDSLCSTRKDSDSDSATRIKTEFLQQMQGVGNPMDGVLVLAATNLPWNLDSAILRRFQRRVLIPLPTNKEARIEMFKIHFKNVPNSLTDHDFEILAEQTHSYSGSDIKTLVQDARFEAARFMKSTKHWKKVKHVVNSEEREMLMPCAASDPEAVPMTFAELEQQDMLHKIVLPPVSLLDCQKALTRCRPSIKSEDIDKCNAFTQEYGFDGM